MQLELKSSPFKFEKFLEKEQMEFEGKSREIIIETRRDPLFGLHSTRLSDKRINKPKKLETSRKKDKAEEENEKTTCIVESWNIEQRTPGPKRFFPEFEIEGYIPVAVPNLFGYSLESKVNFYTSHEKCEIEKITDKDMSNYLLISRENAITIRKKGYDSIFNFINMGRVAGASQIHPHFQDGALNKKDNSASQKEQRKFKKMQKYFDDPFELYLEHVRESELTGFETRYSFVSAPFAPRFPDQLDIILKPCISNFLSLSKEHIDDLAYSLAKSINYLSTKCGVSDLNIVTHQDQLGSNSNYRLHFHIYPRNKNLIGSMELGDVFVVDIYPETTAIGLREHSFKD